MIVPYTLYAEQGQVLRSGIHYLYIGAWLQPDPGRYVVLVHGTLSKVEYYSICTKYKIGLYSYHPANWTDIKPYHDSKLWKQLRAGWMVRVKEKEFRGRLVHNGIL